MPRVKKRYELKLNSIEKVQELLQELYNEADKNIVETENQLTRLTSSLDYTEEIRGADAKAKISKAITDFINTKDKAIGRKMEIAKLMVDVHKYNGSVKEAVNNFDFDGDWEEFKQLEQEPNLPDRDDREEYQIN